MDLCLRPMLKHLIFFVALLYLLAGCSVLPTIGPSSEQASVQTQRTANAQGNLQKLETIDSLVRLDNRWLSDHFENKLRAQAALIEGYEFRRLKLNFGQQAILLDAVLDISDGQGNVISAPLSGEILLEFSGAQLEWFLLIHQFEISTRNFVFGDGIYAEPIPELVQQTLQDFDTGIAQALIEEGNNVIPLDTVPLGEVSVGASLPNFTDTVAQRTEQLRGLFMVTGSAMLIDSQSTALALDMSFIPDLSTCPADVTVSRAGFTQDVESREPVGIASSLGNTEEISYFYSEISGAKQPLTIIHYWFADGLPMALEELPVGESFRWRTWSDRGTAGSDARRWEVLVVEKESGCILHSQAIRAPESELTLEPAEPRSAKRSFSALRKQFTAKTSGFSIAGDKPDIALVEVSRSFLTDVLQASLSDMNLDAHFEDPAMLPLQFQASLQSLATQGIVCEHRDCSEPPVCKAKLAQCKRLRDTRDCTTCQFRNPLNNRCVSAVTDPMCEASRERQNTRYETERASCIADAETLKRECDELAEQALRSCQIESGFQDSTCEAIKTSLQSLEGGEALAALSTRAEVDGTLLARFSNFRIGDNLSTLKLDIALQPDLKLAGKLEFKPADIARPLAECIAAWGAPYTSRVLAAPAVNNLLNNFEEGRDRLTASWSGFGLTTTTRPSPLRAVFVANPQLLANCKIGLTPRKVEQAIAGDDAGFFTGTMEMQVQPLPTTIQLAPATIVFGDSVYSARAQLSESYLRYDIEE